MEIDRQFKLPKLPYLIFNQIVANLIIPSQRILHNLKNKTSTGRFTLELRVKAAHYEDWTEYLKTIN